jgi:Tol biopolymer transport system component
MTARSILALCVLTAFAAPTLSAPGDTVLISIRRFDVAQISANKESVRPSISANGRFIAFESLASDLVAGDTNRASDVFVLDRTTGAIERVSVDSTGAQSNGPLPSEEPVISADGRFVAFVSEANLVPNDTNDAPDIFVHDRATGMTTRVSVSSNGAEARFFDSDFFVPGSRHPSISADGRYVAFESTAFNFVPQLGNEHPDVFVHDRQTGTTTQLSVTTAGALGNNMSLEPSISADGRYVAFTSRATNLAANDANEDEEDVFLHDRQTRTTTRVSVSSNGVPSEFESNHPSISTDGRFIAFASAGTRLVPNDTNGANDIFVYERTTGMTTRVSVASNGGQANSFSNFPAISADGRFVAFESKATNLVAGDTNGSLDSNVFLMDVFIRDRQSGTTRRVSISSASEQADGSSRLPAVSANGLVVAFESDAPNLVAGDENGASDVLVRDRSMSSTALVSLTALTSQSPPGASDTGSAGVVNSQVVSSTGRYVAFTSRASTLVKGDTNRVSDIFLRDRQQAKTTRISIGTNGAQANAASGDPSLSANGRYVAFSSFASNLVSGDTNQSSDIFVRDRSTGTTSRVSLATGGSQADGASGQPSISNDGRYVAFFSVASNLVAGDTSNVEVYIRDRQSGTTTRVSVGPNGIPANGDSSQPAISGNGRYVAFISRATNLGGMNSGAFLRVFLRDRQTGTTSLVSVNSLGEAANGPALEPSVSADGRFVAFASGASNLAPGDTSSDTQIYVRDRLLGLTTRVSVNSSGVPTIGLRSSDPSISADGRHVAFSSLGDGLVPNDTNGSLDVFLHDRETGATTRVSVDSSGNQAQFFEQSSRPSISGDGRIVVFTSDASHFVADDFNDALDVFLHESARKTVLRINAGGSSYTDALGRLWGADQAYNTGETANRVVPISNTTDDGLYQTERWDPPASPELRYNVAVPNGSYLVRLHFAETFAPNFGVGRRVFDVSIEGVRRFDNLDVFAQAGARAALIKSTMVDVVDGQLNIWLRRQVQNPFVDAIELIEQ